MFGMLLHRSCRALFRDQAARRISSHGHAYPMAILLDNQKQEGSGWRFHTTPPFASSTRSFIHTTSVCSSPVEPTSRRRRKRKHVTPESQADGEPSSEDSRVVGIRHDAVTDPRRFASETQALLQKLETALAPLKRFNDPFLLTKGNEEDMGDFLLLDLGPVHGQYTIQVDLEQMLVVMQSPISGQIAYVLSAKTGEWCGDEDGHALEGLLVRDLIRQINGVPKL
jgi:hypothetical protein